MKQEMNRGLSMRAQLTAAIGVACGVALVIAVIAFVGMRLANERLRSVYENDTMALQSLSKLEYRLFEAAAVATNVSIDTDHSRVGEGVKLIDTDLTEFEPYWESYQKTTADAHEREVAQTFRSAYDTMVAQGIRPIVTALKAGDAAKAADLAHVTLPPLVLKTKLALRALKVLQLDGAKNEYEEARAEASTLIQVLSVVAFIGIGFAIACGIWIRRRLYAQLGGEPAYARHVVATIAQGDLSVRLETAEGDSRSVLAAMGQMRDALRDMVVRIKESADSISVATEQIASGNADLSSRTEQQAASLEQTAASMEQFSAAVKQNADNAQQAMQLAVAASDVTKEGGNVVAQAVQTMQEISSESQQMVDIITVIEGIAFQTNILALNAAVEAARAGELGRGFAVVAGEVRSLAQRSATAAKEIRDLIQGSVEKIVSGTRLVDRAGELMHDVERSNARVVSIMSEISTASNQQSTGVEQIGRAVAQLDEVTQHNAALVEEAAGAAQALEQQARGLTVAVGSFRIEQGSAMSGGRVQSRGVSPATRMATPKAATRQPLLAK
ncbi:methyl-accepting chemotaxis protein [Trinickia symbiotica]|uniref:Methyl-accepting chemotaxis protein n=2 Tax=Trinickia symbiotica TaxID=863227 RepID=A0A2N7XA80_9BURK|nr:methyl-accepting chemotaxis protein [Trinickia symbiotica]